MARSQYGYVRVTLTALDGRKTSRTVHSLVLESFRGLRPPGFDHTRHLNGLKSDNTLDNLRWSTAKENMADKVLHGTKPPKTTMCPYGHAKRGWNATFANACRACIRAASERTRLAKSGRELNGQAYADDVYQRLQAEEDK
jgi:hypothetical protein